MWSLDQAKSREFTFLCTSGCSSSECARAPRPPPAGVVAAVVPTKREGEPRPPRFGGDDDELGVVGAVGLAAGADSLSDGVGVRRAFGVGVISPLPADGADPHRACVGVPGFPGDAGFAQSASQTCS